MQRFRKEGFKGILPSKFRPRRRTKNEGCASKDADNFLYDA